MPDYYDVIKEPVALSTLKAKLLTKDYKSFSEFVRDCALISHNAQTYNRPESGAYQDAVVLRREFEKEFKALADHGIISHEVATYPDLGELPPVESPLPAEDEEEDDVDDEEDDEEDEEESDEDGPKRKRKRGPRSTAAISKREGGKDDGGMKGNDAESRKRRGRPPRVDTPMESRIKAVLKAIRKYKNEHGNIIIHQFEKLPDKVAMPEYYMEIKEPIAIEQIKVRWKNIAELLLKQLNIVTTSNIAQRKQKRKKYQSVDHFMRDIDVMFNNAKSYNQDESQIYKDAVYLQVSTRNPSLALHMLTIRLDRNTQACRCREAKARHRFPNGRRSFTLTRWYLAQRSAMESWRLDSYTESERCDKTDCRSDLSYLARYGWRKVGECMLVLPARTNSPSV